MSSTLTLCLVVPTWRIIPVSRWLITMAILGPLNGVVPKRILGRGDPNLKTTYVRPEMILQGLPPPPFFEIVVGIITMIVVITRLAKTWSPWLYLNYILRPLEQPQLLWFAQMFHLLGGFTVIFHSGGWSYGIFPLLLLSFFWEKRCPPPKLTWEAAGKSSDL